MDHRTSLSCYLAQDRLTSLALGTPLDGPVEGSVIFADISGFTTLTAGLSAVYGPRRGAGELSRSLGLVYDGLVAAVNDWRGSVISFAGDAILCWFAVGDQGGPGLRAAHATACAKQMLDFQAHLAPLEMAGASPVTIGLKVAIASGPARRFFVGKPNLQLMDVLTGQTILRAAEAEKTAHGGELVLDQETQKRLASLGEHHGPPKPDPGPPVPLPSLDTLRPWILPAVWAREMAGVGRFLPEFRPTVALFLRFTGFNYDDEATPDTLNAFIQRVQETLHDQGGTLLHVEIGDKGSYLYGAFGAPEVHADDARRAALTALKLRTVAQDEGFLQPVQIGISRGIMRTGSYGSQDRGCYSALGDEVNVAARLMELAKPGEILIAGRVRVELGHNFLVKPLGLLTMKGLGETIPSFCLVDARGEENHMIPAVEDLPLIGRGGELASLVEALDRAGLGGGGVWVITGEPGVGKTRLAEELRRIALKQEARVLVTQADLGAQLPWKVWQPVWAELFGVKETLTDPRGLESLDPKDRKAALESRAVADFHFRTQEADIKNVGLLIIVNDAHAMDQASRDLFFALAHDIKHLPVLLVATARTSEFSQECSQRYPAQVLDLQNLPTQAALGLVKSRADLLFGRDSHAISQEIALGLIKRSQGNPFFLDELVRYFYYRKDLRDLPDSVHALVLNRLGEIEVRGQSYLKCASILGLQFSAMDIALCFPEVQASDDMVMGLISHGFLQAPNSMDDFLREFRHPLTREALYESIDSTTRRELHNRYAQWLEVQGPAQGSRLDSLAHHYYLGANVEKSRHYLLLAGDAAAEAYLNATAEAHYRKLLTMTLEAGLVMIKLGTVLELTGGWKEAKTLYEKALQLNPRGPMHWRCLFVMGRLARRQGFVDLALDCLSKAHEGWAEARDTTALCESCLELATLHINRGNNLGAASMLREAQDTGAFPARVASTKGYLALVQGDYAVAEAAFTQALDMGKATGNRRGIAEAIDNLARVRHSLRDLVGALVAYEQSLEMFRTIGDQQALGRTLNTMGMIAWAQGDTNLAQNRFQESLEIARLLGDRPGQAKSLNNIGTLYHTRGEFEEAFLLYSQSLVLCRDLGEKMTMAHILCNLGMIDSRQGRFDEALAQFSEAQGIAEDLGERWLQGYTRLHRGLLRIRQGNHGVAGQELRESLGIMKDIGNVVYQLHCLIGVVLAYVGGPRQSPGGESLALALVSHIVEGLSREKARVESEFLQPWTEAQAELLPRHASYYEQPKGDWEDWTRELLELIGKPGTESP